MANLLKITNSSYTYSVRDIEISIKDTTFVQDIINYLDSLFTSDEESKIINQGTSIIKNLLPVLQKYSSLKPTTFINVDMSTKWYNKESCLWNNDNVKSAFHNNEKLSQVLTILVKLTDFINSLYFNQKLSFENQIKYYENLLDEKKKELDPIALTLLEIKVDIIKSAIKEEIDKTIHDFKVFHDLTLPIRNYYINMFYYINNCENKDKYLCFIPKSIFGIFVSSYFFIEHDYDFINLIVKMYDWFPSDIRCVFIDNVTKLMCMDDLNPDMTRLLSQFNPDVNILIIDFNTLYMKYLKDPSLLTDLVRLIHIISLLLDPKREYNLRDTCDEELIKFISIQLTIINKVITEKDSISNENIVKNIIIDSLSTIYIIISVNQGLLNSYLVYYFITLLNSLDTLYKFSNDTIDTYLVNILATILTNKMTLVYIASTKQRSEIEEIMNSKYNAIFTPSIRSKIFEWLNIYERMNDHSNSHELTDQLTSCFIVKPCFIPMDNENILCDRYVIYTHLWSKPENPYTRKPLTIKELEDFNNTEENIVKLKQVIEKLRVTIEECKKWSY